MALSGKKLKNIYNDLLETDNNNSGLSTTTKTIKTGAGNSTALALSTNQLYTQPAADSTASFTSTDKDGNALLTVDSTNDLVKVGSGQVNATTQYAYFGIGAAHGDEWAASTHHPIPFNMNSLGSASLQDAITFGTGTDPATTFTPADGAGTDSSQLVPLLWYVHDNITIDNIVGFEGGDNAGNDTARMHMYQYTVTSGSTSALTAGAIVAHHHNILNLGTASSGSEQLYKSVWTVDNADVDAGKVVLAFWHGTVTSNFSISVHVKYHIR